MFNQVNTVFKNSSMLVKNNLLLKIICYSNYGHDKDLVSIDMKCSDPTFYIFNLIAHMACYGTAHVQHRTHTRVSICSC